MAVRSQVDRALCCVKQLLVLVNVIFMLTGFMIFLVGSHIYAFYANLSDFLGPSYVSAASILTIVGILVFTISLSGAYGAFKESSCMVTVFAMSLSVVLVLEFSAALTAYFMQDGITYELETKIRNIADHYYDNSTMYQEQIQEAMDYLQRNIFCCGVHGPDEWKPNPIPQSCFVPGLADNVNSMYVFKYGCQEQLILFIDASTWYIMSSAIITACIQCIGIVFAVMLSREIRQKKTKRAIQRWEMRANLINGYQPIGNPEKFMSFPASAFIQPEGKVTKEPLS